MELITEKMRHPQDNSWIPLRRVCSENGEIVVKQLDSKGMPATIASPLKVEDGQIMTEDNIKALSNLGVSWGTEEAGTTGDPNSIYIQLIGDIVSSSGSSSGAYVTQDALNSAISSLATKSEVETLSSAVETELSTYNGSIDALKPVVLYDGPATKDQISLAQNVANFSYLEIYSAMSDGVVAPLVKIYSPEGKTADLCWMGSWSNPSLSIARARVVVSDEYIVFETNGRTTVNADGTLSWSDADAACMYITKVIGYYGA